MRTRVGQVIIGAVAAAVLSTATGCAGQASTDATSAGPTASAGPTGATDPTSQPSPWQPGYRPSLQFTVRTLDGASFDGASLAGKPAVLWFWAPWCTTCAAEASTVKQLAEQYRGRVNVLGVAGLDKAAAMRGFVTRTGVSGLTHLNDESGEVYKRFGVDAQATYVLLDASGAVFDSGYLENDEVIERVAKLAG